MNAPRILVVDDDRGTCRVHSKVLSEHGYTVDIARNGDQAIELAGMYSYALALLDYEMPGMNGVELFRRLSELQPNMVGVFATLHARIDTIYPAVAAGIVRVLAKPVDHEELIELVDGLVGNNVG